MGQHFQESTSKTVFFPGNAYMREIPSSYSEFNSRTSKISEHLLHCIAYFVMNQISVCSLLLYLIRNRAAGNKEFKSLPN